MSYLVICNLRLLITSQMITFYIADKNFRWHVVCKKTVNINEKTYLRKKLLTNSATPGAR